MYASETKGFTARCAFFTGVRRVVIQPVSSEPLNVHTGCTTRLRGRPCASTVVITHQTVAWAISTAVLMVLRSNSVSLVPVVMDVTQPQLSRLVNRY